MGWRIATWKQISPYSHTSHTHNNANKCTPKRPVQFYGGNSWAANSYLETGEPAIPYLTYAQQHKHTHN